MFRSPSGAIYNYRCLYDSQSTTLFFLVRGQSTATLVYLEHNQQPSKSCRAEPTTSVSTCCTITNPRSHVVRNLQPRCLLVAQSPTLEVMSCGTYNLGVYLLHNHQPSKSCRAEPTTSVSTCCTITNPRRLIRV